MEREDEEIVEMINKAIIPYPKPAVFLSGGLDSTILLHHLSQKAIEPIHTFTAYWGHKDDELEYARNVAERYGSIHHEIKIENIFTQFKKLLPHLDRPRTNLWVSILYEAAAKQGVETVYIGEGADEHFSGYWYKDNLSPQEMWREVLEYSIPTYRQLSRFYDIRVEIPFLGLDLRRTLPYWDSQHRDKSFLRIMYQDVLPKEVLTRRKHPGRVPWLDLWEKEAEPYLGCDCPSSRSEANKLINIWAYREWLKSHE